MSRNNNNANNDIYLLKLVQMEKTSDDLFTQMEQQVADPSINNRKIKEIIRQGFDGVRDLAMDVFDSWGSNSGVVTGGGRKQQQQSSPVAADGNGSLPLPSVEANTTDDDALAQMETDASSRRRNSDVSTEPNPPPEKTVPRSFQTVPLDDVISTIGPISQRSDEPIPAVETEGGRAEAAVTAAGVGSRILAMLRRWGQRLMGFFQRLLNKIRETAVKVWNKVCDAFAGMFRCLRNLWHRVGGYSAVPCEELELQGSTEHHQQLLSGQSAANLTQRSAAMNPYGSTLRYYHHQAEPSLQATAKFHAA